MAPFLVAWSWSDVANIVTAVAVLLGIPFALLQLHHANRTRRDLAAVDVVHTVQTQEVRRAVERVFRLPVDADPQMIRDDPALLDAALAIDSACEMWGCMVFERVVDHRMLDRMVGGWVRGGWRRLHRWVESERAIKQNQNIAEWWQWLYELLEREGDSSKAQGAHLTYRGSQGRK